MSRQRITVLAALATLLFSVPLLGHGGQFVSPGDAGSGSGKGGGVVGPATNPGGASAGMPGAGSGSGSGQPNSGHTSRGISQRRGSGRNGAVTGRASESAPAADTWEFWWLANRDRFLALRDHLDRIGASSGHLGQLTGRGQRVQATASRRPNELLVQSVVVPQLLELLDEEQGDILDSSLLALARSVGTEQSDEVIDQATRLLAHRELSVRSTAALSLGVVGNTSASTVLSALVQDSSQGRRLLGGGAVPWLVRAFAALSLGMIGDDNGVDTLLDAVRRLPDRERDTKTCAVVALGLLGPAHRRAGDAADALIELLGDRRLDPLIAAQAPTALAKLADRDALVPLLALFNDRDSDRLIRESTALAFGQLCVLQDSAIVATLAAEVRSGRDAQCRHFALIALGQIGASSAVPDGGAARRAHDELFELLGRELSGKGKSRAHRPWAALALALHAAAHPDLQGRAIDRLSAASLDESDPSVRGAFAIALGLLKHRGSGQRLLQEFNSCRDQVLRGHLALALGLIGFQEAAEPLRRLCANKMVSSDLRLSLAMGLGMLSDEQTVSTLISTLQGAATLGVASAAARALGMIGDRRALEPLVALSHDEAAQAITRGFAAVALGLLGQRDRLPWNAAIRANANYRAMVPALAEVADIP